MLNLYVGHKRGELLRVPRQRFGFHGHHHASLNHFVQMHRFAAKLVLGHLNGVRIGFGETGLESAVVGVAARAGHAVGGELDVVEELFSELGVPGHGFVSRRAGDLSSRVVGREGGGGGNEKGNK